MSAWREAVDAQQLSDRVEAYQRASPEAVAAREAEYDRIAPRWREFRDAPSFGIVRQRVVRIRLDLRKKRGLNIHWNKQNGAQSAYRYLPHVPLGPEASEPMREVTLFNQSDRHEGR